jgi:flagellar hook assembly protein FlgD
VQGSGSPVLTIQYGVVIKFNQGTSLIVGQSLPGAINAQGTTSESITFKANTTNPTPGYWNGIQLLTKTVSSSTNLTIQIKIINATTAVTITDCSPKVNHVIFQGNSVAGLVINGSLAAPAMFANSFTGNPSGMINNTPSNIVSSYFCWWDDASGPSAGGGGTGESVSGGIRFEPWLANAPALANEFRTFSTKNRTFNPSIATTVTLAWTTGKNGNWTTTFYDSQGGQVRQFTGSGTSGTVVWDGKNGGTPYADGTYSYILQHTSNGGDVATPGKGYVIIDSNKHLTITNLVAMPSAFSPNNDGVQDTTTITADLNFDDANWTLDIKNPTPQTVRTATGQGATVSFVWNGKNGQGQAQAENPYTCDLSATVGTLNPPDSASGTTTVILDKTKPVATITTPAASATVSNVYQNGSTDVNITGSAADNHLLNWYLYYCPGSPPCAWSLFVVGTSPTVSYVWPTDPLGEQPVANGPYTIKLDVFDSAGNTDEKTRTFTLGNFSVSQNVQEFNGSTGSTVTYTSIVPFTLNESLFVYNSGGVQKRTVVNNVQRTAGTYNDAWNGRNDQSVLLPDGKYTYQATVHAGSNNMTWNRSEPIPGGIIDNLKWSIVQSTPFDPFNNNPLRISYTLPQPGMVRVVLGAIYDSGDGEVEDNCNSTSQPTLCLLTNQYQSSGTHSLIWAGTDDSGAYVGGWGFLGRDTYSVAVLNDRTAFPRNAVVLYGTYPTLTDLALSPPVFDPLLGDDQKLTFNLSTYGSQIVPSIVTTYLSQECHSTIPQSCVLRTIEKSNVAPGSVQIKWDGRADFGEYGSWVAPGHYTITTTITDSLGNILTVQILTTVQY